MAAARLTQAREGLVQARAGQVPTVGASGGAGRSVLDGHDVTRVDVGVDAAWEIDLFGRIARGIEAAGADAEAALYDREALRVAIAAEVATNYVQARLAQDRLALARDTLAIADDNLQIAQWRVQAGLVSSLDSEQARAARAQTAAAIPSLESAFASATYRLAVLTGRRAGHADRGAVARPSRSRDGPDEVAVGIPAETLRQRPDVRAAERDARGRDGADRRRRGAALSGPRLSGNIGTTALSRSAACSARSPARIFAGLDQTLFDGGRLRSQVRSQEAATDGALAAYRQSVLTALEDVENALVALRAARARQAEFAIALRGGEQQRDPGPHPISLRPHRLSDHCWMPSVRWSPRATASPGAAATKRSLSSSSIARLAAAGTRRARKSLEPIDERHDQDRDQCPAARADGAPDKETLEVFLGAPAAQALVSTPGLDRRRGRAGAGPAAPVALLRRRGRGRLCDREGAARQPHRHRLRHRQSPADQPGRGRLRAIGPGDPGVRRQQ